MSAIDYSTSRAADRVAELLAFDLLESDPPEGTMLPPEEELAERYRCSRSALRGALRILEAWGLVWIRMGRNGGAVIRRPHAQDLARALSVLLRSQGQSFGDALRARRAVDCVIASAAARSATEEQLARLDECVRELDESRTEREFIEANADLYAALSAAAGLVVLGTLMTALTAVTASAAFAYVAHANVRREAQVEVYRTLLAAIRDRDPVEAERVMLEFRLTSEAYWTVQAPMLMTAPLRPFTPFGGRRWPTETGMSLASDRIS